MRKAKQLRRLLDLSVSEVSLVDSPATEKRFVKILKRKADEEVVEEVEEEIAGEEEGLEDDDGKMEKFEVLCLKAAEAVEEIRAELETRTLKLRSGSDRKPTDPVSFGDVLKLEEFDSVASLLEATEKVFGPVPYDYPFRRGPYPNIETSSKAEVDFDPEALKTAIMAAMKIVGIPVEAKTALEAIMEAMKAPTNKMESVSKKEFDTFAVTVADTIAALAGTTPAKPNS